MAALLEYAQQSESTRKLFNIVFFMATSIAFDEMSCNNEYGIKY